jgi:hypothetical protein
VVTYQHFPSCHSGPINELSRGRLLYRLGRSVRMIDDSRNWAAIVAVAGALPREKTLDGFELKALVRAARQDVPRPA